MEGDERQPLLAASPASSTPSRNGTSASDELSGERSSPRGAPPTKEHPTSSSSTTPPPAAGTPVPSSSTTLLPAAGTPVPSNSTTPPPAAGTPVPSSSPPAVGTPVPSSSPSAAGTPVPSSSPTAAGVPKGRPSFSSTKRSAPTVAISPSAGVFWDLSGRMRRAPSHPPVPAPPGLRETLRRQGARFDSVGVEKLIGILGFSLFGSLSLLPFTVDRVKDDSNITETHKIILVLIFGLIWVLASVGFLCGLHGKSDFEQAVCRFTARLGILGLTLLVILNLIWMLPSSTFATVCFYIFMIAAVILHIVLWITSCLVGEDKIEEIAGTEQQ